MLSATPVSLPRVLLTTLAVLAGAMFALLAVVPRASGHADHPGATTPDTTAPGLVLRPVGWFKNPTYVTSPPGESHRQFVTAKRGFIRVILNGTTLPESFLDIHDLVSTDGERGLLSMAFSHDYATSRLFYVFYTEHDGDLRVDEFKRSATNPNVADRSSRRRVIEIPHRWSSWHNGGQLQFGRDRYLYMSTGDGGGGGDPQRNGQKKSSLLGKVLRIAPRHQTATRGYSIPSDNPFVGRAGHDEIWAYGLRNPWRFSFDRATGDFTLGDVGQNRQEEVDFVKLGRKGMNFGWNCFEGTLRYSGCIAPGHVRPALGYSHKGESCSVTGGYVLRDPRVPQLAGKYVYGDYCTGSLHAAKLQESGATSNDELSLIVPRLTSFGEDAAGRLYATSYRGTVYRLDPDP